MAGIYRKKNSLIFGYFLKKNSNFFQYFIAKKLATVGLEEKIGSKSPDDATWQHEKKNQMSGLTPAWRQHDISATLGLELGLNWPEGQPVFVGLTPNPGLGSSLERHFFFTPPALGSAHRWSCSKRVLVIYQILSSFMLHSYACSVTHTVEETKTVVAFILRRA
ncbi:unnamed protein product [Prunus armeniaca]